ncbi:Capsular polysaccharide synthesis protein [Snodgrassella alvi SCGC AB-598-O11]|nr:Capsular polysaccharide synthesis protein [Snodgrassella alvi SCGC AB-598-O11]KES11381.1 Capsular polysaccharide synthesis protein [Snodgrassella alvi SCGC AB-598-O11]
MKSQNNDNYPELASIFFVNTKWAIFFKYVLKQPFRMFYFCFVPKIIRRKISFKAELDRKAVLAQASKNFLELYFKNKLSKFNLKPKKILTTDKIIWQYWGQGIDNILLPETVKICFKSIDIYKEDYQVIRLDDSTIGDYLDIPDFVWAKRKNKQFKFAFFSDLLRLALLDVYGGIWIDATILLTNPIPETIKKMNFFMFQRDKNTPNKIFFEKYNNHYFGWNEHHHVNVLNSFIVSDKKGVIVHILLDLLLNFWKTQDKVQHYFFFHIMVDELFKYEEYKKNNCPVFDDTLVHIIQSKMHESFNPEEFELIKQKTSIHKLTYVKKTKKNSYYEHIRNSYL